MSGNPTTPGLAHVHGHGSACAWIALVYRIHNSAYLVVDLEPMHDKGLVDCTDGL